MANTLKMRIKKQKMVRVENGQKLNGFVGRVITNGTADYEAIATEAGHNTTAHKAEIKMSLELCMEAAANLLKQGMIVDLGPLGKLYPSVTGKWVADEEELSLSDMKGKVNFRASDDIVGAVKAASLSWASAKDATKPTTDEEAGDTENTGDDVTGEQGGTTPTTNGENNEP